MSYDQRRDALRRTLLSEKFFLALEAMEFAERFHTGLRKDGSHEFSHQVEMAEMILAIPDVPQLDETLAVCFLHDLSEDYHVRDDALRVRFGAAVADAVALLDTNQNPFRRIAGNPIAALVKGVDRTHNLSTMDGAFTAEKQRQYRGETAAKIRPMLVDAQRRHSSRRRVIGHVLGGLDTVASIGGKHAGL